MAFAPRPSAVLRSNRFMRGALAPLACALVASASLPAAAGKESQGPGKGKGSTSPKKQTTGSAPTVQERTAQIADLVPPFVRQADRDSAGSIAAKRARIMGMDSPLSKMAARATLEGAASFDDVKEFLYQQKSSADRLRKFIGKRVHIRKVGDASREKICHHYAFGGLQGAGPAFGADKLLPALGVADFSGLDGQTIDITTKVGGVAGQATFDVRAYQNNAHSARFEGGRWWHKFGDLTFLVSVEGDENFGYTTVASIKVRSAKTGGTTGSFLIHDLPPARVPARTATATAPVPTDQKWTGTLQRTQKDGPSVYLMITVVPKTGQQIQALLAASASIHGKLDGLSQAFVVKSVSPGKPGPVVVGRLTPDKKTAAALDGRRSGAVSLWVEP